MTKEEPEKTKREKFIEILSNLERNAFIVLHVLTPLALSTLLLLSEKLIILGLCLSIITLIWVMSSVFRTILE